MEKNCRTLASEQMKLQTKAICKGKTLCYGRQVNNNSNEENKPRNGTQRSNRIDDWGENKGKSLD